MKVPDPKQPGDWQTAYTRDDAHRDSEKFDGNFTLPLWLCALFALTYFLLWMARQNYLTSIIQWAIGRYGSYWSLGFGLVLIVALVTVLFPTLIRMISFPIAMAFFTEFYRPPEGINLEKIIEYRLWGKPKLPWLFSMFSQFEYLLIQDAKIIKADEWPAWMAQNLGGPIMLVVFDGCALYLERGNRFSRVVGPGEKTPFLEWYETIKYVVDLRPKIRNGTFETWTKDGIKINVTAQIECRIGNPAKKPSSPKLLYPYDPEAVKKAVERYALRWPNRLTGDPEEFTWIDAAWGQVTGIIPGYIGSRMLDDLVMAERVGGQILSPESLKNLIDKLNGATNGFGVYLTDFQILKIEFPPEVYEYQNKQWEAEKQSLATAADGDAKAHRIRVHEKMRADAQRDLILTIANGLHQNQDQQLMEDQFIEPLLLSLSGLLDESLKDPISRADLARQKLESLEELQKILLKSSQNDNNVPPIVHFLGESDENRG